MGEIPDADGVGTVGNPVCGDMMTVYIKVRNSKIEDIKFKTFGCGAAIATSSMVTELAKGKEISKAERISRLDVANSLGGLPKVKMHCSNLAADALKAAIEDYRKRRKAER
jgi:nitrogen fixation NifU-like protein